MWKTTEKIQGAVEKLRATQASVGYRGDSEEAQQ